MLRTITILSTIVAFVFLFAGTAVYTSAPPSGCSGSPADGGTCASCHNNGPTKTTQTVTITNNVPGTGYAPGTTYTITVTATGTNPNNTAANEYGFQACVESGNVKRGTLIVTDGAQTQLNNTNWINHTANGITGSSGSKSWSFNWTAPAKNTGTVTIYAVANITNGDNGSGAGTAMTGDLIITANRTVTENTSLPVSLIAFSGSIAENGNVLIWQTAAEFNNNRFEVERAGDDGEWKHIATIDGNLNSTTLKNYTYTDQAPLMGNNYYRLKQVDVNGAYTSSKAINLLFSKGQQLSLQPNIGEEVKIYIPEAFRYATLEINDTKGNVLKKINVAGADFVGLTKADLPIGIYYAHILGDKKSAHKFVIF